MTTTKRRKATTTYKTEKGNLLEAVRSNDTARGVTPVYSVRVNGEHVGSLKGQRGWYSSTGQASYLTSGGLDEGLLYAAACSLAGKDVL